MHWPLRKLHLRDLSESSATSAVNGSDGQASKMSILESQSQGKLTAFPSASTMSSSASHLQILEIPCIRLVCGRSVCACVS